MIRKNHNHELQTTPWYREEEPPNHHETPGRQTKQSNQLSLFLIKMTATPERTQSNVQQNIEQLQTPTMGVTINKKSTTTQVLLRHLFEKLIYLPLFYRDSVVHAGLSHLPVLLRDRISGRQESLFHSRRKISWTVPEKKVYIII